MDLLLACQRCGSRAVYSDEVKGYVCSNCHNYVGTMIRCPDCEHLFRVSESTRPLNFSCPDCGKGLGLTRENKMVGGKKKPSQVPVYEASCNKCGRGAESYWWYCPGCGDLIKPHSDYPGRSCPGCKLMVEDDWDYCVFCSTDLSQPVRVQEEPSVVEEPVTPAIPTIPVTPEIPTQELSDDPPYTSSREEPAEEETEVCPGCGKPVKEEWLTCQYCMAKLGARRDMIPCPKCGKDVKAGRMMCSHCYTDLSHHKHAPQAVPAGEVPKDGWEAETVSDNSSTDVLCPLCDSATQYSEEARDYYCWSCRQYIGSMER